MTDPAPSRGTTARRNRDIQKAVGCVKAMAFVLGFFLLAPGLCFVAFDKSGGGTIGAAILALALALIASGIMVAQSGGAPVLPPFAKAVLISAAVLLIGIGLSFLYQAQRSTGLDEITATISFAFLAPGGLTLWLVIVNWRAGYNPPPK